MQALRFGSESEEEQDAWIPGQDEKPELFSLDGENKQSQQKFESLDSCIDKSMERELLSICDVSRWQC